MVEKMMRRRHIMKKKNKYELEQEKMFSQIQKIKPLFQNKQIISFGFNCYVKIMLQKMKIEQETQFFDWIGTSIWAILRLLKNSFESVLERDELKYIQTIQREDEYVWTDMKYYLRFPHDFQQTHKKDTLAMNDRFYKETKDKYERRAKRFLETLHECENKKKQIVFIRLEEDQKDRIKLPEYPKINDELPSLFEISQWIQKHYPNLSFYILFISRNSESYQHSDDLHLIVLSLKNRNENTIYSVPTMIDILFENKDLIDNILR